MRYLNRLRAASLQAIGSENKLNYYMKLFKNYDYFRKYNTILGWGVFLLAAVVYLMTMEPTASMWDCPEYIATAYKLQVMHPPGAPLFMLLARFFTMFASPEKAAMMVNAMSCIASAFTIMFIFWTISWMGRKIYGVKAGEMTLTQVWTILGASLVGAASCIFMNTFWFSAVEADTYALTSTLTMGAVWAMLKWDEHADEPHGNRWLVLVALIMGLSIGLRIITLLTIPALAFIYYFRKTEKVTWKGILKTILAAAAILVAINVIIMPGVTGVGAFIDRALTNGLGFPMNLGLILWFVLLLGATIFGVYYTHKKGKVLLNTLIVCFGVILVGYSTYGALIIRASANPPMNSNNPNNAYSLLYVLNREQYGSRPLVYGEQYPAQRAMLSYKETPKFYKGTDGKYKKSYKISGYEYPDEFKVLFPRMWSMLDYQIEGYKQWGEVSGKKKIYYNDQFIEYPTAGENMRYFFNYQLNFMYWRYFLWNFVGRQSDNQSTGEITDGQWMSGIKFIDEYYLGPQDGLPSEMERNKGRNKYYFLPFILGLIGLIYQLNRDPKNFTVVMLNFIMMGVAVVVYFNTAPGEPRERDYIYSGSFYTFCIWIGLGVMCVKNWLVKLFRKDNKIIAVAATVICAGVPVLMAAQNWDDHDRSHRYVARDIGWNYLQTCLPNSIIIDYGDNDTFPLWYNQEVEGVRPDVRVMNMSYLAAGWYAEEMLYKFNESDPVPFSLPLDKYMYKNELLYVEELVESAPIDAVIDFIKSDSPVSYFTASENITFDFVPTRKIIVPVNKENALECGIVKPEDAHLMLDTIEINITGGTIDRGEMMLLDLLANFDWKRPIYFTVPRQLIKKLGMLDYMQFDGYAYRLVPIKTPEDYLSLGRIDVDLLYHNMMEVFRWGNVADPRVYVDGFTKHSYNAAQVWGSFARLADGLSERGDTVKAVGVLDYGLEQVPPVQLDCNIHLLSMINSYYRAGAMEKGDKLFNYYLNVAMEYIDYFSRFPESWDASLGMKMRENVMVMMELSDIAVFYGREELQKKITDFIYGEEILACLGLNKNRMLATAD